MQVKFPVVFFPFENAFQGGDYRKQMPFVLVMARNRGHPADRGCGLIICAFRQIQDGCSFLQ